MLTWYQAALIFFDIAWSLVFLPAIWTPSPLASSRDNAITTIFMGVVTALLATSTLVAFLGLSS